MVNLPLTHPLIILSFIILIIMMILYRKLTPSNNPDMVYYNDNNKANQIMNNINNIMNNKIDKKYKIGDTKQVEDSKNIDELPKIIFRTGKNKYQDIDNILNNLFNRMIEMNDNINLEYYDDTGARDFIINNYPSEVLWAYDKLIPGAYKADLFRYCILYKRGGIYSDLTQIYNISLDKIIDFKKDNLVLVDDLYHNEYKDGKPTSPLRKGIQISFIASRPKNEIFLKAINGIIENCQNNYYGKNPLEPTGPWHFRKILDTYNMPYRIGLKQMYDPNHRRSYLVDIEDNSILLMINKLSNHSDYIKKEHYHKLWIDRNIYRL